MPAEEEPNEGQISWCTEVHIVCLFTGCLMFCYWVHQRISSPQPANVAHFLQKIHNSQHSTTGGEKKNIQCDAWNEKMECFESICEKIHSSVSSQNWGSSPPCVCRSYNSPGCFIEILIMGCYDPLYTLIQPEVLFFFHGSCVIFVCLGFFLNQL